MSAYTESVAKQTEGLEHLSFGICASCETCQRDLGMSAGGLTFQLAREMVDEGGFSWHPCEICGSALGGTRYTAHAILDGELVHLSGCADCLCYVSNGDEPQDT